jgi:hypothetical protein
MSVTPQEAAATLRQRSADARRAAEGRAGVSNVKGWPSMVAELTGIAR